jgi:putative resolvase
MDGHRRRLARLLSDPAATVIVVGHCGRLTGFGFEHLQASLASAGRRVVVAGNAETAGDVVGDVTGVLTLLCARLYGRRSASRRAAEAVAVATGDGPR